VYNRLNTYSQIIVTSTIIFCVCVAKECSVVNSETRTGWNLHFYYVNYHYSVIALGKSNEYCTEIVSWTPPFLSAAIEQNAFALHRSALSRVFVM